MQYVPVCVKGIPKNRFFVLYTIFAPLAVKIVFGFNRKVRHGFRTLTFCTRSRYFTW